MALHITASRMMPLQGPATIWKKVLLIATCLFSLLPIAGHADDIWVKTDASGQPEVQLYFFWSLTCPHCTAAHPYIEAIPQTRPWVMAA